MSEILNKKALVESVAEKLEMTKKDATVAVDTVFEEIVNTLANDGKVDISGFGKFEVSERPARMGINPATKEPLEIAASKSPKFKAAKAFKEAVK
ncbi:HU family DNA-binding protein [[Eubacterium] hominis]|uniref:HU family DNA-binding protein n=1 Tax=[Eubacterium] hominis TaxID=2764325 RepID=UPI003A4DBE1A